MAYLDPPPFPAPVIVMKDVGGLVSDYEVRTEQYRREGREVRLHECRSACTLALSLPTVCVYPTSILKFHKAYDETTKIRDEGVSASMFSSYPRAVQAKLGGLTQEYRVLTGAELIALGMRDCNANQILIARAKPSPPTVVAAAPTQTGSAPPNIFGSLLAALAPPPVDAPRATLAPIQTASAHAPVVVSAMPIPLPPPRPADIDVEVVAQNDVPLPPPRPASFKLSGTGLPDLIVGAQPILPSGVLSFAPQE